METQKTAKFPPALVWSAGIAMVVFFATGTAAIMGWIPASIGHPADAAAISAPAKSGAAIARPASPKAMPASEGRKGAVPASGPTVAATKCADCGVVESVREVESKGEGTGLGAVGGAVVGGVLGREIGGGRGKDVATVIGAVGGVVAGNEIEKRVRATKSYEVDIRLDDGSRRVVREANLPAWRAGDRVRVVDGTIRANG